MNIKIVVKTTIQGTNHKESFSFNFVLQKIKINVPLEVFFKMKIKSVSLNDV